MSPDKRVVLCTYRYDPLDRLADCASAAQDRALLFYQKSRLATQIQGQIQHTLLRTDEHLLAQRRTENNQSDSALLVTDQQQSVIAAQGLAFAYTPYGHRHPSAGPMNLPGYTGQRLDPVTGHYLLGNGYRAFNPVLMRFNSPDSLSPFGEGGLNAYAYCEGDPVNRVDPSGHMLKRFRRIFNKESDDKKLLIAKKTVQNSSSHSMDNSVVDSMPTQATTSRASGVGAHVSDSNTTDKLSVDAPPPRPSRNRYMYVGGKNLDIHEVNAQLATLVRSSEAYTGENNDVPFAMRNNINALKTLVKKHRDGSDASKKSVDVPTRFR